MTLPLFYANPGDIDHGAGRVVLSEGESRHLAISLRAKTGDGVLVADGTGAVYRIRLSVVAPEMSTGLIESRRSIDPEKPVITLFQAVARITKMDETVARAAESGIASLVPFISPRSPGGSTSKALKRLQRWKRIALEASKVARRPIPLMVGDLMNWPVESRVFAEQGKTLVLWEDESTLGLREALPDIPAQSIGLVVGPEGGFQSDEIDILSERGAVPVSLGDLILRTETAGAYVAMLIRYNYNLLEPPEV